MNLMDILQAQQIGTTAKESGILQERGLGNVLADLGQTFFGADPDSEETQNMRDTFSLTRALGG